MTIASIRLIARIIDISKPNQPHLIIIKYILGPHGKHLNIYIFLHLQEAAFTSQTRIGMSLINAMLITYRDLQKVYTLNKYNFSMKPILIKHYVNIYSTIYSNMITIKYDVSMLIIRLISTKRKYQLRESDPASLSYILVPGFDSRSRYFNFMVINIFLIIHNSLLCQIYRYT